MKDILKKKFLILFLALSLAFSFVPTHVAHAGGLANFLSAGAISFINSIVSGNINAVSLVSASFDPVTTGSFCGSLGQEICGSFSSDGGLTLTSPSITSVAGSCHYQVPVTFYNPRMNVSYAYASGQWAVQECSYGMDYYCTNVPVSTVYSDSGCSISVSSSFSTERRYSRYKSSCVGVSYQPLNYAIVQDPNFDETTRQVAIYRFTLPKNSSKTELSKWFVSQIPSSIGIGWNDYPDPGVMVEGSMVSASENYQFGSESTPLVTLPYSEFCSGNVCKFTDGTVPEDSYVAYAAKILGTYNYIGTYNSSSAFNTRPNKFLNNDNNSTAFFPPHNNTLGNAIVGPFEIGKANCPSMSCTDTDGGKSFYTGGTVTYKGDTYSDSCLTSVRVNEYFCEGSPVYANSVEYNCPFGCDSASRACKGGCSITLRVSPVGTGTAVLTSGGAENACGDGGVSVASATPYSGYSFSGWDVNGDGTAEYSGSNNPLNISHNTNWVITALFAVTPACTNGANDPPTCTTCPAGKVLSSGSCVPPETLCTNGATNYPTCTTCPSGKTMVSGSCIDNCTNGANNPPTCNACSDPLYWSGSSCVTCGNGGCCSGGCCNGANNPTACNACSNPLYWNGSACVACDNGGCCSGGCCNGANNPPTCSLWTPTVSIGGSGGSEGSEGSLIIIDEGQSATLTWTSTHATSCTSAGGFSTGGATSGSASVSPTQNSTYQITCSGPGGSSLPSTITVQVLHPNASISADPARVQVGMGTSVSWTSSDVKSCAVKRNGVAWKTGLGSSGTSDTITSQTVYTITCQTNSSPITKSMTVNTVPLFNEF